ncbi:MAG: HD domain-containing phosphohydrolase, partial [Calditrichota bacterium]
TEILYNTTSYIISEVLVDPTSVERIQGAQSVVESAVKLFAAQPQALGSMMEVSSYDYYTYTHCVHVMTYAIALARHLGVASAKELESIGSAALLHDVGKIYIDHRLITKNGTLTADEFEEVKKHPELGYQALHQSGAMSEYELLAVRMHHEKLNGKGYPYGLEKNHLNLAVRIITCMDIYDALVTRRTYRDALTPYEALQVMKNMVDTIIDGDVFRKLVIMLGML